jgi:type II secretion system protein J
MKVLEVPTNSPPVVGRRSAFTLVELLVGISVMTGIVAAAYLCLQAGYDSRKVVEYQTETLQKARVAMALIAADLRQACRLSEEFEFVGTTRELADVEVGNLDFATHNWEPQVAGESDFCEISYFVDRSQNGESFSLYRRRDPTPDERPFDGGFQEEIATHVESLLFEYYDGFFWYDSWGRQRRRLVEETERSLLETNLYGLPDAVRITLAFSASPELGGGGKGPGSETRTETAEVTGAGVLERPSPLLFQTVVFLNLAGRANAFYSSSSDSSDTSGAGQTSARERDGGE